MSQEVLSILKDQDLREIQEDPLGSQAWQLDRVYPGAHADTETPAVLRPCNASDPRQLWGSSYSQTVDVPVLGVTRPPVPMIRNSGSASYCLTAACSPNATGNALTIRQCKDWNHDQCPGFGGQVWQPHTAGRGADLHVIVSNRTSNASDPHAPGLCLTAPTAAADSRNTQAEDRASASDQVMVGMEECADASDGQTWKWKIDPLSGGDAHPDHPGTTIEAMGAPHKGECLSTAFTEGEMNEVYVGHLESKETAGKFEGSWVVAFFNRTPLPRPFGVDLKRLRYSGKISVDSWKATDIWGKADLGTMHASEPLTKIVAAHDVALFRLDAVVS